MFRDTKDIISPHILTRPVRLTVMIFLISSFFVISPVVILYTAGFRYDVDQHQIKMTGVLSIDVKPRNALIWINNILVDKKIPIRLTNRAPGTYHLKIESQGYKTWEKDITISSNQTTYIRDITLFKDAQPVRENVDLSGVEKLYSSSNHPVIIALSQTNNMYEVSSYNTQTKKISLLLRTPLTDKPEISISPFADAILIINRNAETNVRLFSMNDIENPAIFTFQSDKHISYQWNENDTSGSLYVKQDNTVEAFFSNGSRQNKGTTSSTIWYVDQQGATWGLDDNYQLVSQSNNQVYSIDKNVTQIVDMNGSRIIAQTNNQAIVMSLVNDAIKDTYYLSTKDFFFHRDTREWWAWSSLELWSIYQNGNVTLFSRGGDQIQEVVPLDEFGVMLMHNQNGLVGFNPGYYISHTLLSSKEITSVAVYRQNREIYFAGKVGSETGLFKLVY